MLWPVHHTGTRALDIGTGTLPDMAQPNDLEARVAALETQVQELIDRVRTSEQDAAAARVLAGGADRDVAQIHGEIRDFRQATTSSFNAMRDDLTDLRVDLTDLRTKVGNGFIEMRGKLDATAAGQQQIVGLLNTLITQQGGQLRLAHRRRCGTEPGCRHPAPVAGGWPPGTALPEGGNRHRQRPTRRPGSCPASG